MKVTVSKLRENLYSILDQVLETGVPVEVIRKGKTLRIVPETKLDKLSRQKNGTMSSLATPMISFI